ncbi:MAG: hypothetical protein JWM86_2497 [Thermoleophilia bacterium]|nr:hypothetical protein [Thermoleophilia bacterium]
MGFLLISILMSFLLTMFLNRMLRRMLGGGRRRQSPGPFGGGMGGGLFGPLVLGGGSWTSSYEVDPDTGEWRPVDERAASPATETDPVREPAAGSDAAPRRGEVERPSRAPARQAPSSPFGGLFGQLGGMGSMGGGSELRVIPPSELPTFADVGGMEQLKQEVRDTVGLVLEHPEDAAAYGIDWNGILLHGRPGAGKTWFARAIAGEFGMGMLHVSTGDLVGSMVGQSAQNIEKAFRTADSNLPCLLFFDEFDSVAQRRDQSPDQESRRTVNQLLTSLEAHRDERSLVVMAATNDISHLDPAVIRPGRFDRHIRIDLPDAAAREAIFETQLRERPIASAIDLDDLVRRSEGMTPASIAKVVDMAALAVFREATRSGKRVEIDTQDLLTAIEQHGGEDRPTVEHWTWDSMVLPADTKAELQELQAVIEDPESARRFGVDPPTGLLLAGPPGTGKTTIAKVLAAQARCSFYPISGADVISKWVGESEGNIRRLFERARENRPSIVFIDEIDAIAGRRGEQQVHDQHVNQLLAEIDGVAGQKGLFVVGATNRPDQLDPALLRGGRLSRTLVIGLPDEAARRAILGLYTARMPTLAVDLDALAAGTDGASPADLKAICQEAAMAAMVRTRRAAAQDGGSSDPVAATVTHEDFLAGVERLREDAPALA